MTIPYYILGIVYLVGLLCATAFFFFNLYHLRRFGFFDFTAFVITILTAIVLVLVMIFSVIFLVQVDWLSDIEIFNETLSSGINF